MAATPKKTLSADDILNALDLDTQDVEVPEWGGVVKLRALNAAEAIEFMDLLGNEEHKKFGAVKLVGLCAVDEHGERLFTVPQVEQLKRKSIKVFMRLQKIALQMNGFTEGDAAVKNA